MYVLQAEIRRGKKRDVNLIKYGLTVLMHEQFKCVLFWYIICPVGVKAGDTVGLEVSAV